MAQPAAVGAADDPAARRALPRAGARLIGARAAVTAAFALNGAIFGTSFARLPAIRDALDLGEGALGIALLGAMLGTFTAQPLAGALVRRTGTRPLVVAGGVLFCLTLVPVALAPSLGLLVAAMVLFGVSGGMLDVSMNVHGLTVERALGRPILSTLHAGFSFGALAGAASAGVVAEAGVGVEAHFAAAAAVLLVVHLITSRGLLPADADGATAQPEGFVRPPLALAGIGVVAFAVLFAEGAVNDWSAVHLRDEVDASAGAAAAGLAAFQLTMGTFRLLGDRLAERLGSSVLAAGGAAVAAAAMALAALAQAPLLGIAAFMLMGVGLAPLFPLALRAAARVWPDEPGPAVAAASTMGYTAFLTGPPLIGFGAELSSLRVALLAVVPLLLVAAALARRV